MTPIIEEQLTRASLAYAKNVVVQLEKESGSKMTRKRKVRLIDSHRAAYLTGVSQMANWLAGNDGMTGANAQNVMTAVSNVGKALNMEEGRGGGRD